LRDEHLLCKTVHLKNERKRYPRELSACQTSISHLQNAKKGEVKAIKVRHFEDSLNRHETRLGARARSRIRRIEKDHKNFLDEIGIYFLILRIERNLNPTPVEKKLRITPGVIRQIEAGTSIGIPICWRIFGTIIVLFR
jgi:hypothetical protein